MGRGLTAEMRAVKRSFTSKGHRTAVSLEGPFWAALREAAAAQDTTLAGLVAAIDARRGQAGLSSAVRVWVLDYYRGHTDVAAARTAAPGNPYLAFCSARSTCSPAGT